MTQTKVYRKLRLNRVDFVDNGANPGANITLAKRAPTEDRQMAEIKDTPSEAVAKRLADLETEKVELAKRVSDAEEKAKAAEAKATEQAATVAKMLEDAAKAQAVTVAKGMDKLPGDSDKLAHLIFTAKRKMDEADYESLVTLLKAADAQIKAGALFRVSGVDGAGEAASDLDKLVNKRMADKNESQAVALAAVMATPEGKAAYSAVRGH